MTAPANQAATEGTSTSFNLGSFSDPDGGPWSITVNWGDGSSNTTFSISSAGSLGTQNHTYADDDGSPFTVTVTVTDSTNLSDSKTFPVNVSNANPVADAGADQSGTEGSPISFTFSCTDAGTADTWTASVDWGDGSGVQSLGAVTCNSGTFGASHTYADNGNYTVMLTVTDDDSGSGNDSAQATVANADPVANAGADKSDTEGSPISFTFSCTDAGTADTWTASVDWGDGSAVESLGAVTCNSGTFGASHTYADDDGSPFTVTLTVSDDDGGSDDDTASANIANADPVANAGADQSETEGSPITFTFSCTDAGTADTWTASVEWGDGNSESLGAVTCNAGSFTAPHTYADDNGSPFTVTLTVTDDDGGSGNDTATATIANAAPVVTAPSWQNASVNCRTPATLAGISFSDAGVIDDPWNVDIDWGDGSTDTNYDTNNQGAQDNQTHTYNTPGTYTAIIEVTDKDGGSGSNTSNQLTVNQTYTVDFLPPFDDSSPSGLIVNKMKNGRVVPVKITIYDDCAQSYVTDPTASVTIKVTKTSGTGTGDPIEEYADAGQSSAGTNAFRWTTDSSAPGGGFWIYNLDSKALGLVVNSLYRVDAYVGLVKATVSNWAVLQPMK